jgi:hypothetical protein
MNQVVLAGGLDRYRLNHGFLLVVAFQREARKVPSLLLLLNHDRSRDLFSLRRSSKTQGRKLGHSPGVIRRIRRAEGNSDQPISTSERQVLVMELIWVHRRKSIFNLISQSGSF